MSRRIDINIESHRLLIIRRRCPVRAWCETCGSQVEMITPNEAAVIANVSSRTIYRWIEAAEVHFREEVGGSLMICAGSLCCQGQRSLHAISKKTNELLGR